MMIEPQQQTIKALHVESDSERKNSTQIQTSKYSRINSCRERKGYENFLTPQNNEPKRVAKGFQSKLNVRSLSSRNSDLQRNIITLNNE